MPHSKCPVPLFIEVVANQAAVATGALEKIGQENHIEKMKPALAGFEREIAALLPEMENCVKEIST